jgi:hypothetical protein
MSFFIEANAYLDASYIINTSMSNSQITTTSITASSIDMLSSSGNYQFITNVQHPELDHDASTKYYVDSLGITINNHTLISTQGTLVSSIQSGSCIITVKNKVLNGPSAIFNVTKNEPGNYGHIVRTAAAPGTNSKTLLDLHWPINSGIYLYKTGSTHDGTYQVKIM